MIKGFRKFAVTQMAKTKVDPEIREKLVGHNIGMAEHYIRYDQQNTLAEYIKAVDLLAINEENRLTRKVDDLTISIVLPVSILAPNGIVHLPHQFSNKTASQHICNCSILPCI
jgi:hypothetical protein